MPKMVKAEVRASRQGMLWGILVMEETSVDINILYIYIYTDLHTNDIHDAYAVYICADIYIYGTNKSQVS